MLKLNTMKLKLRNNGWLAPSNSPISDFFESNEFLNDGTFDWGRTPAVNVFENEDEYTIELAIPGMDKDDFNIRVDEGVLTISCENDFEEDIVEGEYTHREYNYNSFSRSFTMPEDAMEDEIEANYVAGELVISIPKAVDVVMSGHEIEVG